MPSKIILMVMNQVSFIALPCAREAYARFHIYSPSEKNVLIFFSIQFCLAFVQLFIFIYIIGNGVFFDTFIMCLLKPL